MGLVFIAMLLSLILAFVLVGIDSDEIPGYCLWSSVLRPSWRTKAESATGGDPYPIPRCGTRWAIACHQFLAGSIHLAALATCTHRLGDPRSKSTTNIGVIQGKAPDD
jgi:hypothetical protein